MAGWSITDSGYSLTRHFCPFPCVPACGSVLLRLGAGAGGEGGREGREGLTSEASYTIGIPGGCLPRCRFRAAVSAPHTLGLTSACHEALAAVEPRRVALWPVAASAWRPCALENGCGPPYERRPSGYPPHPLSCACSNNARLLGQGRSHVTGAPWVPHNLKPTFPAISQQVASTQILIPAKTETFLRVAPRAHQPRGILVPFGYIVGNTCFPFSTCFDRRALSGAASPGGSRWR